MNDPTKKQLEVLNFIKDYQENYGVMPTLVEIGTKLGYSVSGVQQKIDVLLRKKVMERKNIYIIKKQNDLH